MSHLVLHQSLRTAKAAWGLIALVSLGELPGCSGGESSSPNAPGVGGSQPAATTGGSSALASSSGGAMATGSETSSGGTSSGGTSTTVSHAGGTAQAGGALATGGAADAGGRATTGGAPSTGGRAPTGGAAVVTGGSGLGSGGARATGGAIATAGASAAGATAVGGGGSAKPSAGCGKTPSLKNSPTSTANQNTLTVSGASRQFLIRWPSNYDKTHPYRLILDFHGATGKDTDIGPAYFGLFDLSNNSTIFVAPSASGGIWALPSDLTFVDQILTAVEADLCIDTSRIEIEGFSQGAALVWNLACQRPGVFRAAVGHSGGGLGAPASCQPIPYFGSGGLQENVKQTTQTDQFAKFDGCTVASLPTAPKGGHVCTSYSGCPAADPVRWCNFDGPHTPSPTDSGKTTSWMPAEVWQFFSQF